MKRHEFQNTARQFRAGKITLNDFTDQVFPETAKAAEVQSGTDAILAKLANRKPDSHKGDYGRVLVVAGSPGMPGAAGLTGLAALRSGAGLVTVATDRRCQQTVASFHPAMMTVGLAMEEDDDQALIRSNTRLEACNKRHDCLAIGPGIGQSLVARGLMRTLVSNASVPMVVDADGINALVDDFDFDERQGGPIILTPHPGELRRLMPKPSHHRSDQEEYAINFANPQRIVVLKGHRTLITDGTQKIYNATGNPGMATAGSGDVLTGIITALIGQGLSTWDAAVVGCYVHGKAGDEASRRKSRISMVATDIIDALPSVLANN